jgi:hypothetical protein
VVARLRPPGCQLAGDARVQHGPVLAVDLQQPIVGMDGDQELAEPSRVTPKS